MEGYTGDISLHIIKRVRFLPPLFFNCSIFFTFFFYTLLFNIPLAYTRQIQPIKLHLLQW